MCAILAANESTFQGWQSGHVEWVAEVRIALARRSDSESRELVDGPGGNLRCKKTLKAVCSQGLPTVPKS